jgi:hypothetical protein
VPLHCTRNYNGQLTNQHGIHGLWETRLPELFFEAYDPLLGRAVYIANPDSFIWCTLRESYAAVDSVLSLERTLDARFPSDQKYSLENKGGQLVRVYSSAYSDAYHQLMSGMVERRLRLAAYRVGCLWYTAWVNAGMPDCNDWGRTSPDLQEVEHEKLVDSLYTSRVGTVHGHVD